MTTRPRSLSSPSRPGMPSLASDGAALLGYLAAALSMAAADTSFTPPPGPMATPAQIVALLATVPKPATGETVVDFEKAVIGEPRPRWEDQGVSFELAGPLQRTPAAKPRIMFFPHLATGHKGILNAMATDQGVPLKMTFPDRGASSVTLVVWGSTGCPAVVEAFTRDGTLLEKKSVAAVPGRQTPDDPVPFLVLTLRGEAISYLHLSGPRAGEFLAVDELRFVPSGRPDASAKD